METIKLTNWADYDDCGNPDGTDAWNLSDGSVDAYPGMTPRTSSLRIGEKWLGTRFGKRTSSFWNRFFWDLSHSLKQ